MPEKLCMHAKYGVHGGRIDRTALSACAGVSNGHRVENELIRAKEKEIKTGRFLGSWVWSDGVVQSAGLPVWPAGHQ